MNKRSLLFERHSVRKFSEKEVPMEDIKEIIKCATSAPSGKNIQNWHFVVVNDKEKIDHIAKLVEERNAEIADEMTDEKAKASFTKFLRFATLFRKAPALILVYGGPYEPTGLNILQDINAPQEEIEALTKPNPAVQNIGAAIQNLMLAATDMGYGTCWMTSPNYAVRKIENYINLGKEGFSLMAMTPLGVPEGEVKFPPRKDIEEVMTVL
ncbi:nitroreductase family protein [Anaeromicrobium sediminis]|uniref:Nitroreductase n=1 Tax=Anaeromicrobium sediminis TaxID=1478221 RepID=A0A267MPA7_9FIRM|nr:nitroreductase family protein [Anaeromicrobium sediminis]PAB60643.1 nitroreductase [Anaeromicrobium sediminis]